MGSYNTTGRAHILDYLQNNSNRTVTVSDISNYLDKNNNSTNVTTIYRYLDKLVKEKKLIKYVAEKGKQATFQYIEDGHSCECHLHLQCVSCGEITHLECSFMDEIATHIRQDHGFLIQCKNSIIYGTCAKCSKAAD